MRLLLDTNVFLWWQWRDRRDHLGDLHQTPNWQTRLCWKSSNGLPRSGDDFTATHAELAGDLPRHHGDPFDRMLIAQAKSDGFVLATEDRLFSLYGVPVLGTA